MKSLFDWIHCDFESRYLIDKSIERLDNVTIKNPLRLFSGVSKIGKVFGIVKRNRVCLSRYPFPFFGNTILRPIFVGLFKVDGKKVILSGKFTIHLIAKLFLIFWFSFMSLWILMLCVAGITSPPKDSEEVIIFVIMLLSGIGMLFFMILTVIIGKWLVRNDITYISQVIETALSNK